MKLSVFFFVVYVNENDVFCVCIDGIKLDLLIMCSRKCVLWLATVEISEFDDYVLEKGICVNCFSEVEQFLMSMIMGRMFLWLDLVDLSDFFFYDYVLEKSICVRWVSENVFCLLCVCEGCFCGTIWWNWDVYFVFYVLEKSICVSWFSEIECFLSSMSLWRMFLWCDLVKLSGFWIVCVWDCVFCVLCWWK